MEQQELAVAKRANDGLMSFVQTLRCVPPSSHAGTWDVHEFTRQDAAYNAEVVALEGCLGHATRLVRRKRLYVTLRAAPEQVAEEFWVGTTVRELIDIVPETREVY